MRTVLACALAVLIPCPLSAEDKKEEKVDAKKLVGVWEPVDVKGENPPLVLPTEFTKDGKAQYAGPATRSCGAAPSSVAGGWRSPGRTGRWRRARATTSQS